MREYLKGRSVECEAYVCAVVLYSWLLWLSVVMLLSEHPACFWLAGLHACMELGKRGCCEYLF